MSNHGQKQFNLCVFGYKREQLIVVPTFPYAINLALYLEPMPSLSLYNHVQLTILTLLGLGTKIQVLLCINDLYSSFIASIHFLDSLQVIASL